MISKRIDSVFRNGSRTYFYSSIFFPADVREDVFKLYAFVRLADDFVDQVPQESEGFHAFVELYHAAMDGAVTGDEVVDGYVELAGRKDFDPAWTESFLDAMRQDLTKSTYETMDEVEGYMYGSAEVIGLLMARVLGLPEEAHATARRLGTAMQYLNFLRDVEQDESLGRTYIPREVLSDFDLESPSRADALADPERFQALMRHEVRRYKRWNSAAETGYRFLPRRYRIPIKTAADMYYWTAMQIERDPMLVFEKQIKPSVVRIVTRLARNALGAVMKPQEVEYAGSIDPVRPAAA